MRVSWRPLGDFFVRRGGSVDPSRYPDESFDLYSIPAYDSEEPDVLLGAEIGSPKKKVQPRDVLLSRIVPHIRRCWIVGPERGRRQIASGEWIIFRTGEVHHRYLRHFLLSDMFHVQFMRTVSGVGGSLLRARPTEVEKIEIPLPPLPEQKRIAAILDKADAIRKKRKQAIALTEDLLRSTFLEMFGDPVLNPKGWDEVPLSDLAEIRTGVTKGRRLNGQHTVKVPYMRVANVQDGYLDLGEVAEIEVLPADVQRYRLRDGDILITEGGDPDKLGRGAVWRGEIDPCIHQNHVFCVRVNAAKILPEYLCLLIGSARGKRYFLRAAKQTTGIATINKSQLSLFPVLVPPMGLQKDFVSVVRKIELLSRRMSDSSDGIDGVFCSLAERAFRGEL